MSSFQFMRDTQAEEEKNQSGTESMRESENFTEKNCSAPESLPHEGGANDMDSQSVGDSIGSNEERNGNECAVENEDGVFDIDRSENSEVANDYPTEEKQNNSDNVDAGAPTTTDENDVNEINDEAKRRQALHEEENISIPKLNWFAHLEEHYEKEIAILMEDKVANFDKIVELSSRMKRLCDPYVQAGKEIDVLNETKDTEKS